MSVASLQSLKPTERLAQVMARYAEDRQVLYQLSPLQSFASSSSREEVIIDEEVKSFFWAFIYALSVFDLAFRKEIPEVDRQVYLLDDEPICRLLASHFGVDRTLTESKRMLELLSTVGLVYRFSVAPKFGYEGPQTQLRINAWGLTVFGENGLTENLKYNKLGDVIREKIDSSREVYSELIGLCESKSRPLDTRLIHRLNEGVDIPIVA